MNKPWMLRTVLALAVGAAIAGCANQRSDATQPPADLMQALQAYQSDGQTTDVRLKIFDELDFDVYSHQKWGRLSESHAEDILVHYPDGSTTKGLPDHIKEMDKLFAFAPDTRVVSHPVKFGTGEWTAAISVVEGTFTRPMPIGGGKVIQPTGKAFKYKVVTLGRWNAQNVMVEEYLFWDNQSFAKQIGLAQ